MKLILVFLFSFLLGYFCGIEIAENQPSYILPPAFDTSSIHFLNPDSISKIP